MFADYDKNLKSRHPIARVRKGPYKSLQEEIEDIDGPFYGGRWYYYGIDRMCEAINKYGYNIISKDLDLDFQNPICYFEKPF